MDKRVNLSLTTSPSPIRVYEIMSEIVSAYPQDFLNIHYCNFDNMDMEGTRSGFTMEELCRQYLTPANVAENQIHCLQLDNQQEFIEGLNQSGGLDAMLIGIGADGHFCGNMPGSTQFLAESYEVPFGENSWSKSIWGDKKIPESGVTLGALALFKVKHLIMIANGKGKAEAIKNLLSSPVDDQFPSSILKLHPNFTLILDEDAASLLS